jgi:excisionase family DNA binding protein
MGSPARQARICPSGKAMTVDDTVPPKGARWSKPLVLHTVQQVADTLQISDKQVRRWINAGDLIAHRFGRQLRVADADLRAFVAQRRIV